MDGRRWTARHGFWPLALLWLPAGIVAQAVIRFGPDAVAAGRLGPWLAMEGLSLAPLIPCGLPLALGCRRLWRRGYRRGAWTAGAALAAATVMVTLPAGLLGPLAIAVCAVVLSLPVWIAWLWLARLRIGGRLPRTPIRGAGADDRTGRRAGSGAGSPCASPDGRPDGAGPATQ